MPKEITRTAGLRLGIPSPETRPSAREPKHGGGVPREVLGRPGHPPLQTPGPWLGGRVGSSQEPRGQPRQHPIPWYVQPPLLRLDTPSDPGLEAEAGRRQGWQAAGGTLMGCRALPPRPAYSPASVAPVLKRLDKQRQWAT